MKILITTDVYQNMINGVAVSVHNLCDALEAQGNDVRILTLSPDTVSYQEKNVYFIRSRALSIYPDARYSFSFHDALLQEIIAWKPEIIHSQCEFFTFAFAKIIARKLSIPIVHTYHTLYEYYTHYFCPCKTLGRKIVSLASRFLCNSADMIIAPTEKTACILNNYGVKTPMQVIPTGLNLEHLQKPIAPSTIADIKASLEIPESATVFISLGRVAQEKNIEVLIDAMTSLRSHNCHLVIAGDGPARKDLEKLVTELQLSEIVHFTGMVSPENVSTYYQLGNIFVSASQSETQGLTYIEAMACGLPLLCQKDLCLQSVLNHGDNGFFFEDKEDLIQYVFQMQTNPSQLQSMSHSALRTANIFSKETFAVRALQCYTQTIISREEGYVCSPFACIPRLIWPKGTGF